MRFNVITIHFEIYVIQKVNVHIYWPNIICNTTLSKYEFINLLLTKFNFQIIKVQNKIRLEIAETLCVF